MHVPKSSKSFDLKKPYLEFLSAYQSDFSKLSIAIDSMNGMAALFTNQLFGTNICYVNNEIDGTFPGHDPNPLNPENQDQIKDAVLKNACDIGLIFDGAGLDVHRQDQAVTAMADDDSRLALLLANGHTRVSGPMIVGLAGIGGID